MNKLSRFTSLIEVKEDVFALWNSLWLRVIFVTKHNVHAVQQLQKGQNVKLDPDFIQALENGHFFASVADREKLVQIRKVLKVQPIGLLYLIMTEGCNLACDYCFLYDMVCNQKALKSCMTFEVAKNAIDLFRNTVATNAIDEPKIIFYGGEPLLNWNVLVQALLYAKEQIPSCTFTINTNGTLITPQIAQILHKHRVGVALSIDGKSHDVHRKNRGGNGSLKRVLANLQVLQEHDCIVGVSCTVTETNMNRLTEDFLWMVEDLNLHSVDFNVLLGKTPKKEYAQKAATQILKCYQLGKTKGVYVDRIMRRVNPFVEGKLNLVDCGGCGQQLVCAPDGMLGCCHAFLNDRTNFFPSDEVRDPENHPLWSEWKQRSPFNMQECLDCRALGICGGGCFYNSYLREGDIWKPDQAHCTLAKETLQTLLSDMWENMQK